MWREHRPASHKLRTKAPYGDRVRKHVHLLAYSSFELRSARKGKVPHPHQRRLSQLPHHLHTHGILLIRVTTIRSSQPLFIQLFGSSYASRFIGVRCLKTSFSVRDPENAPSLRARAFPVLPPQVKAAARQRAHYHLYSPC